MWFDLILWASGVILGTTIAGFFAKHQSQQEIEAALDTIGIRRSEFLSVSNRLDDMYEIIKSRETDAS